MNRLKSERLQVITANYGNTRKLKKSWHVERKTVFSLYSGCNGPTHQKVRRITIHVTGIYNHEFPPLARTVRVHVLVRSVFESSV